MIAATPNERVCLQNCFHTGSGEYWVRRMRQLPPSGPSLKIPAYSFILLYISVVQLRARGTILHKSCRYRQWQPFFFGERYDFGTKIGISEIDSN